MGNPAASLLEEDTTMQVVEPTIQPVTEVVTAVKDKPTTLVFHARPSKDRKDPSHTLCFHHEGDLLLCTYSKPHPGLESYCKATGRDLTQRRMATFLTELQDNKLSSEATKLGSNKQLFSRYVPSCVRKTIKYYAKSAVKYFKMTENPLMILRGQFADWETYMAKGRCSKVPVHAIWLPKPVEEL